MSNDQVIVELQKIANHHRLNDVQAIVFFQSFYGATYSEIAVNFGYNTDYIKEVGSSLWKLLSRKLRVKINKKNLRMVIGNKYSEQKEIANYIIYNDQKVSRNVS